MTKDKSTEKRILEAAKKVFCRKGMSGARMQEVADEANINKAMLHYYFRSKAMLFHAVFRDAMMDTFPRLHQVLESDDALFAKIERFIITYIELVEERPYLPNFIINELMQDPDRLVKTLEGNKKPPLKFAAQVKKAVASGEIVPIHPHHLMVNIMSMCVYPFIAKPLVKFMNDMDEEGYKKFTEERKTETVAFVLRAIKK